VAGYATSGSAADIAPPSVPAGVQGSGAAGHVSLTWDASGDNTGVSGYRIYRDGRLVARSDTTSYSAAGLTPGSEHVFAVAAYDSAGNSSAHSPEVSVTS